MKPVQRITEPLARPLDDSEVGQRPSPAVERKHLEDVSFSVSARVAMQLGRESISSSITAIIELVKNAYDADAGRVRICFAGLKSQAPRLVIEDNGFGMRVEDIRDQWMIIGTSHKSVGRKPTSRGRVLTGEKGLGPLSMGQFEFRKLYWMPQAGKWWASWMQQEKPASRWTLISMTWHFG